MCLVAALYNTCSVCEQQNMPAILCLYHATCCTCMVRFLLLPARLLGSLYIYTTATLCMTSLLLPCMPGLTACHICLFYNNTCLSSTAVPATPAAALSHLHATTCHLITYLLYYKLPTRLPATTYSTTSCNLLPPYLYVSLPATPPAYHLSFSLPVWVPLSHHAITTFLPPSPTTTYLPSLPLLLFYLMT